MKSSRRPSLWHRLTSGRRTVSGPDFGDMGTAFGLDAITPAIGDWELVRVSAPELVETRDLPEGHAFEQHLDPRAHAHMLSTSEPS